MIVSGIQYLAVAARVPNPLLWFQDLEMVMIGPGFWACCPLKSRDCYGFSIGENSASEKNWCFRAEEQVQYHLTSAISFESKLLVFEVS